MPIEQSNGKARPTLTRATDLPQVPAAPPPAGRDAAGRFAPGNKVGAGKQWITAVYSLLGTDPRARILFAAILRDLPSSGAAVRMQVAEMVRAKLAGTEVWDAAVAAGLRTPAGADLEARAIRLGERAERLAVTAFDIATRRTGIPTTDASPPHGLSPFAVPKGGR